ncbi:hypothetical protein B0H21DRAFT_670095, partial [Amylocystis lapponica]
AFVATADAQFGPITTIRQAGKIVKKIPWSAFQLREPDWRRVQLCADILEDPSKYQQAFSSDKVPTLHRVIPALEAMCTRWEKKLTKAKYAIFHPALEDGLAKLNKYYRKLDDSRVYVLSMFIHPYYKLQYINEQWGGADEQEAERAAGNPHAKNWKAHAHGIVEAAMSQYWPKRLNATQTDKRADTGNAAGAASLNDDDEDEDDYDRTRRQRLTASSTAGWEAELK